VVAGDEAAVSHDNVAADQLEGKTKALLVQLVDGFEVEAR